MWILHRLSERVRPITPLAALVFGSTLLYLFFQMGFWSIIGPIGGFVAGSLFALIGFVVARYRGDPGPGSSHQFDWRIAGILTAVFVIVMIAVFQNTLYHRPPILYLLFGGFAGTIGYQIAGGASHRRILPQIGVLAFFTYWSSQMLFPAGMYGPDTHYRYLPAIREALSTGFVPDSEIGYLGHEIHAVEFITVTDLSPQIGYYLLATLLLVATIAMIGMVARILPAVTPRMAQFGALVFATSSWMIGRGMHPNKLNYFYALILLVGLVAFQLFRYRSLSRRQRIGWIVVGTLAMPAIIFGHRYSAGAAMFFLLAIAGFGAIARWGIPEDYDTTPGTPFFLFTAVYVLAVLGNPILKEPLYRRLDGLIDAVFSASGGGGGPGRYSKFALDVLAVSTAAQTILFCLAVMGAIWMVQRHEWEYDAVIVWIVGIGAFLAIALLQNTADTSPQRFYSMLVLFGFNVATGAILTVLSRRGSISIGSTSVSSGQLLVALLLAVFAIASLASPVADTTTSPVGDKIPDFRQFETNQRVESAEWLDQYAGDELRIIAPHSEVPVNRTGRITGVANRSVVPSGAMIAYSALSNRTGVTVAGGLGVGGRNFLFVPSPERSTDSRVYVNGETTAFILHRE